MKLIDEQTAAEIKTRMDRTKVRGFEDYNIVATGAIREFLANERGMTNYAYNVTDTDEPNTMKPELREIIIKRMLKPYDDWIDDLYDFQRQEEYWLTERYPTRDDLWKDAVHATDENLLNMYVWFVENETVYG